ncbi:MAG TPA: hydroxymethylbilane synthase [Fimbriimonas sp.]|nr:hydroxymethylbilane synthase [Fimbriimonas sp.]
MAIRLGTRGSTLAMIQATTVAALLEPLTGPVEIVKIRTSGDADNRERLGAFVSEIQESLARGEIDLALHCLKDVPTTGLDGLTFAAYLKREDPRDALLTLGGGLDDLPQGAVVGTGSLRRTSQLALLRPDLTFKPLVGNVDSRVRKLVAGEYDAIVLAMAGLIRMGWTSNVPEGVSYQALSPETMLPAPGQAVLVLQARENDVVLDAVAPLNDRETETCSIAERAFLNRFGGGCSVPVATLASAPGSEVSLTGLVCSPDGTRSFRGEICGDDAEGLGRALAEKLGGQGGFSIVEDVLASRQALV